MQNISPLKIVNKKNIYVFLSIAIVSLLLVISYYVYKNYIISKVSDKMIRAMIASGYISEEELDPITKIKLLDSFRSFYKTLTVKELYDFNNTPDEDLIRVVKSKI